MSINSTDPGTLFGGTWQQLKDRFLLGVGDTYRTVNTTGGESTHTLTEQEMPRHNHTLQVWGNYTTQTSTGTKIAKTIDAADGGYDNSNSMYNRGESKAHNNMPPYLTVYMWKRTQ